MAGIVMAAAKLLAQGVKGGASVAKDIATESAKAALPAGAAALHTGLDIAEKATGIKGTPFALADLSNEVFGKAQQSARGPDTLAQLNALNRRTTTPDVT